MYPARMRLGIYFGTIKGVARAGAVKRHDEHAAAVALAAVHAGNGIGINQPALGRYGHAHAGGTGHLGQEDAHVSLEHHRHAFTIAQGNLAESLELVVWVVARIGKQRPDIAAV